MTQAGIPPVSFKAYAKDFAAFTRALGAAFERYGWPTPRPSSPCRSR
jgi:hypothetical protein